MVDSLAEVDFLNKPLLEKLTDFITSLIKHGNLGLARALRYHFSLMTMAITMTISGPNSF